MSRLTNKSEMLSGEAPLLNAQQHAVFLRSIGRSASAARSLCFARQILGAKLLVPPPPQIFKNQLFAIRCVLEYWCCKVRSKLTLVQMGALCLYNSHISTVAPPQDRRKRPACAPERLACAPAQKIRAPPATKKQRCKPKAALI